MLRISESVFYSQAFFTLHSLPKEAEDFLRGDRYFKHVPPPTYLIYLSPKDLYTVGLFYALWLLEFVKNLLLVGLELYPRQA